MGIDVHGLNFLRYAKRFGDFGATVMLGRQGVHLSEKDFKACMGFAREPENGAYAETLLRSAFGASQVDSIDYSDYEGASILHDFNKLLPQDYLAKYDTVLDFGTLEHVFEINQALRNCSLLCRPGGQILHVLPANNLCGHGFWQFSPEMFHSLYTEHNGYKSTSVMMADLSDTTSWFVVDKPSQGRRINIKSRHEVYIMVRTTVGGAFSHASVQQSDYVSNWGAGDGLADRPVGRASKPAPASSTAKTRPAFYAKLAKSLRSRRGKLNGTPFLHRVEVSPLAGSPDR